MPFRQLPNTDEGRNKALQQANGKAANTPATELAFSKETKKRLDAFYPVFQKEVQERGVALKEQSSATDVENTARAKVQMYLSHFIQVFNFGIARGMYSVSDRAYYQLHVNQEELPPMSRASDVLLWGKNIIDGEAKRVKDGGKPMLNPDIKEVKAVYDDFVAKHKAQSSTKDQYDKEQEDVENIRAEADDIIIDVWDEVEFTYRKEPPSSKRRKAREYGVVYVSRPGEEPEEGVIEE